MDASLKPVVRLDACRGINHLLAPLLLVITLLEMVSSDDYVWKTGPWSDCEHTSCGEGGMQNREIWCAHKTGWATLEVYCDQKLRPHSQQNCFHICDFHRHQYVWKPTRWSLCRVDSSTLDSYSLQNQCESGINQGRQARDVECVAKCTGRVVPDYICDHFNAKPDTSRICKLQCPEDCILTAFNPWSSCDNCWLVNQTRYRTILSLPSNGGRGCEPRVESRPCPTHRCLNGVRKVYRFKVGRWSDCQSLNPKKWRRYRQFFDILGYRDRDIKCIDESGKEVEERLCANHDKPASTGLCRLSRDCVVTAWSKWLLGRSYSNDVVSGVPEMSRSRAIMLTARGQGRSCPNLEEKRTATYDEIRDNCNKYEWITGNWSACRKQLETDSCGAGKQFRKILCIRSEDGVPVRSHFCDLPYPMQVRQCELNCPVDCIVSEWTAWTAKCWPHGCRLSKKGSKMGYRKRSRQILRESAYGGAECPHTKEQRPCTYPDCYIWRYEEGAQCELRYPAMQCGDGLLNRTARCVGYSGNPVSTRLCVDPKPSEKEACDIPCNNDCVTSPWSLWSECSRNCDRPRQTSFRIRSKEILALPSSGGRPCPSSRMLIERERCTPETCTTYHWMAQPWGRCNLSGKKCGEGTQGRSIDCFDQEGSRVSIKRCEDDKPILRRNCSVPCPRPCVVSPFTDWSSCPVSCFSEVTRKHAYQARYRFVLDEADDGGDECPELKETRPCPNLPRCTDFTWKIGSWSNCIFSNHYDTCGTGYRARDVRCVGEREHVANEEYCLRNGKPVPEMTQICTVDCDPQTCKFSDWSQYSLCPRTCGSRRHRWRTMEGDTSRIAGCYDTNKYPINESYPCPCPQYTHGPMDDWSDCVLDDTFDPHQGNTYAPQEGYIMNTGSADGYCGIGRRVQAIVCHEPDGYNTSAATCKQKAFMEEMCFIPCPRDCIMSAWSAWSRCVVNKCGIGYQNRSRYIVESQLDGGRACPPVVEGEEYESRPCYMPCNRYSWITDDWSACTPVMSRGGCGSGLQSRTVRCVLRIGTEPQDVIEVTESKCDRLTKPIDDNHCHVPCPGQCVVTEWTEWTTCPKTCDSRSRRVREREIVRRPATGSGTQCPHLQETEACEQGANCFLYSWHWSGWSACLIDSNTNCGRGRRKRYKECIRDENSQDKVANELCSKFIGEPLDEHSEEDCEIPCPVDCLVSVWTDWTPCSASCGLGFRFRSRQVLIEPANRGRLCPEHLQQKRPCVYADCYRWEVKDWNACKVKFGSCGWGERTRDFKCMRHDDTEVSLGHCAGIQLPSVIMTTECFESCPGDCLMSEWSSWSACHRPCTPDGELVGKRTRSRSILSRPTSVHGENCPTNLVETESCNSGPCVGYSWQASIWVDDQRDVWCESSDGVRVLGGCLKSGRPANYRRCDPECTEEHSFCRDSDICDCEPGYTPIRTRNGFLIKCSQKIKMNKSGDITAENLPLYYPNGATNLWIYAVIASGCALLIFTVVAVYTLCTKARGHQGTASRDDSKMGNTDANSALLPKEPTIQTTCLNGTCTVRQTELH